VRLWILAILFYGIGDTVTTIMNLRSGCVELNPVVNLFVAGYGELGIILPKISIIAFCYYLYRDTKSQIIPIALFVIGLLCIAINVCVSLFKWSV